MEPMNEKDLHISDILRCQQQLREKHEWAEHTPDIGAYSLLWTYDEMGEIGAILKKKGHEAVMNHPQVRAHFVEECADVFMYLVDMMDCFGISAEEFSEAYCAKWKRNMNRTWEENKKMYEEETPEGRNE